MMEKLKLFTHLKAELKSEIRRTEYLYSTLKEVEERIIYLKELIAEMESLA